jgi:PAS domain S-box-containing protein
LSESYSRFARPEEERDRAESIQSLRRLSVDQILESAPDAMLIIGHTGEIVYLNKLAECLFGYERKELLGRCVEVLIPPEARSAHTGHRRGYFQNPRVRMMETGLELYGLRRDNSRFPVEISLSPLETPVGTLVLGAVRDRTRKQKVEAKIQALNRDLEVKVRELDASNRELQEFTYSTAHDLRAPVRHMQGYAELVLRSAESRLDSSEIQNLTRIVSSGRRLGQMIDGLLEFSRIGRTNLNLAQVNLKALLTEIKDDLQKESCGREIFWKIENLHTVMADPGMLRVLFTNLLDNALKFTRTRDRAIIEIGCIHEAGWRTVFVRDNGVGFEMEYVAKLFEVFQRLHRHEEFEGTGIGLAAVRRIAERHGGKVRAEGVPGKGATFYVSFPEGDSTS